MGGPQSQSGGVGENIPFPCQDLNPRPHRNYRSLYALHYCGSSYRSLYAPHYCGFLCKIRQEQNFINATLSSGLCCDGVPVTHNMMWCCVKGQVVSAVLKHHSAFGFTIKQSKTLRRGHYNKDMVGPQQEPWMPQGGKFSYYVFCRSQFYSPTQNSQLHFKLPADKNIFSGWLKQKFLLYNEVKW